MKYLGKHLKKVGGVALAILLLCTLLVSLRVPILTGMADFLIVNDTPLTKVDLIFVLNGDINTRPFFASDLYLQGLAPRVAIARSEKLPTEVMGLVDNSTDIAVNVMKSRGVPAENISVLNILGPVTSTFDEALALRQYVENNEIHSIILVTSAFHSRRARWVLEKELAGLPLTLQVAAAPHLAFSASNWWQSEEGLIYLNNEYVKLIYYWLKYR